MSASTGVPMRRPTQFGSSSAGDLQSAVNLFRGSLDYTLPLVQLGAPSSVSPLQVQIGLSLQSDVSQSVRTWNVDQPTGVLGVGWSLPSERIVLQGEGAPTPAAATYAYDGPGGTNPLIRARGPWVRATLDTADVGAVSEGTVSAALVAAFAAAGLALSDSATVASQASGASGAVWTVTDDALEHLWRLVAPTGGAEVVVEDGGVLFELQEFQFWRVAYYARWERWEITDDSGVLKVFGGGLAPVDDDPSLLQSAGNSVAWSVKWGGPDGTWTGPSARTEDQAQFASAWYLRAQQDRWANTITYAYNDFPRADGVLGRGVEQRVGAGGLAYTKDVVPTRVVGPYGRQVLFLYGDKTYTAAAQEYVDPHKDLAPAADVATPPDGLTTPNAYQDRYGTLFLSRVEVREADGSPRQAFDFVYAPPTDVTLGAGGASVLLAGAATAEGTLAITVDRGTAGVATVSVPVRAGETGAEVMAAWSEAAEDDPVLTALVTPGWVPEETALLISARPGDAVVGATQVSATGPAGLTVTIADVAAPDAPEGAWAAARCKRYLLAIGEEDALGRPQPGYGFDYVWATQGGNLGAIRRITFPQGGGARFAYRRHDLHACLRAQDVAAPVDRVGSSAVPYVFYGSDYAVTVWSNAAGSQLTLEVHTWIGRWQRWVPAAQTLYSGAAFDPSSLQFVSGQDGFAVAFTAGGATRVYPFRRDPERTASWIPLEDAGVLGTSFDATEVTLAAGARFVTAVIGRSTSDGTVQDLYRLHYDGYRQVWLGADTPVVTGSTQSLHVLAHDEVYAVMAIDALSGSGTLGLHALGADDRWIDPPGALTFGGVSLSMQDDEMVWAADRSMLAFCVAGTPRPAEGGQGTYQVQVVRWDATYTLSTAFDDDRTVSAAEVSTTSWPPAPVLQADDTVGLGAKVWRYDGVQWIAGALDGSLPGGLTWLAFAYGEDVTVQSANQTGQAVEAVALVFDADAGAFSTHTVPTTAGVSGPEAGFPHAQGSDFVVVNDALVYRGTPATDGGIAWGWADALDAGAPLVPSSADSVALVDQSPGFVAWVEDADDAGTTRVATLCNGGVDHLTDLEGVYAGGVGTASVQVGQQPAGPDTLTTFDAAASSGGIFAQAQAFTLHRFAGQRIDGALVDHPVAWMSVWNGFGERQDTAFRFDPATAAADSSGQVMKYYRSTTFDGTRDPRRARCGRKVTVYLNDLFASGYSMLEGQELQQISFEGAALFAAPYDASLGLDPLGPTDGPPVVIAADPSLAGLAALFDGLPTPPLSPEATLAYRQLHVPEATAECDGERLPDAWAADAVGYRYWEIVDAPNGRVYTLDYDLDPEAPDGLRGYVGRMVQSQSSAWALFTTRSGGPADGTEAVLPLHGAFARNVATTTVQDGVPLTRTLAYVPEGRGAPISSGVVRQTWTVTGADGAATDHAQVSTSAALVSPALHRANVLAPVAQQVSYAGAAGGTSWAIAGTATDWSPWTRPDGVQIVDSASSWAFCGAGATALSFPFGGEPDPAEWTLQRQIRSRDDRGEVAETVDAAGCVRSTARDGVGAAEGHEGLVPTLLAHDASLADDEAMACGFERDEDLAAWTLDGGAAIAEGIAHTGSRSLHLPAGASATRAPLSPGRADRAYVLACWYRIEAGDDPGDASLSLTVTVDGAPVGTPATVALDQADGTWRYAQAVVDLAAIAGGAPASVTVSVVGGAAGGLGLDDVRWSPIDGGLETLVLDPVSREPVAWMDGTVGTGRATFDGSLHRTLRVAADGRLHGLSLRSNSRQATWPGHLTWLAAQVAPIPATPWSDRFDPARPSATIDVRFRDGGHLLSLTDGDAWQRLWAPGDATAWSTEAGALVHAAGAPADVLTATDPRATGWAVHAALRDGTDPLRPVDALAEGFALEVGDAASVRWTGSGWQLVVGDAAPVDGLPVAGPPEAVTLVLVAPTPGGQGSGWLVFLADGEVILSAATDAEGLPRIAVGAGPVALTQVALGHAPSLEQVLQDATGQRRQVHALDTWDYTVHQVICDERGDPVVRTKEVPGTFGDGAARAPLAYRPGLVDVEAFRLALAGDGVMTGDAADWYDGSDPASGRTDDGGYPYTRRRLEAAPTARMLELGMPGAGQAIVDPYTTPDDSRPTIRWRYGSDAVLAVGLEGAGAGRLQVTSRRNPAGQDTLTVKDAAATPVARITVPTGGGLGDAQVFAARFRFDAAGPEVVTRLPNAALGPAHAAVQRVRRRFDPLRRMVSLTTPEAGETRVRYDAAGHKRLVQDAAAREQGYVLFRGYDRQGRQTVQGVVSCTWETAIAALGDTGWPLTADPPLPTAIQQRYTYDGDGSDPRSIGQLVQMERWTGGSVVDGSDPHVAVTTALRWTTTGSLRGWTTRTAWADGQGADGDLTLGFTYDAAGHLSGLALPDLDGVAWRALAYDVDVGGKVRAIRDAETGAVVGSWTRDPMAQPVSAALGDATVAESRTFDPPGHLLDVADDGLSGEAFSSARTFGPDNTLLGQTDTWTGGEGRVVSRTLSRDPFGRLVGADTGDATSQGFSYLHPSGQRDRNGDLQAITGAQGVQLAYARNRLVGAVWDADGAKTRYGHLANGVVASRTTSGGGAERPDYVHAIVEGGLLPATTTVGDTTIAYAYDGWGNRVGKRVTDGAAVRTRLTAPGRYRPFLHLDDDGAVRTYVWGSKRLVGFGLDGARYTVASDALGTPRAVFDASGAMVATYEPLSYGAPAVAPTEPSPGFLPLGFTGAVVDDETGLLDFNARLYDPSVARFTAPDPMLEFPSSYVYAGGRPYVSLDPSGQLTQLESLAISTGLLLVGVGLCLVLPESVPFLSWAVAGAFLGAGSSGAFYDLTTKPSEWSSSTYWTDSIVGFVTGFLSGGITGGLVGKEAPITESALRRAGFDAESGSFTTDAEQEATSTLRKTRDVGTEVYKERLKKRRPAYFVGYTVYSVSSTFGEAVSGAFEDEPAKATVESVGMFFLYPVYGVLSVHVTAIPGAYGSVAKATMVDPALRKAGNELGEGLEALSEVDPLRLMMDLF